MKTGLSLLATSSVLAGVLAACADSHSTYAPTDDEANSDRDASTGSSSSTGSPVTGSSVADGGTPHDAGLPETTGFTVGGTVAGVVGSGLVLEDEGVDDLTVSAKVFTFPRELAAGSAYDVTVKSNPTSPWQTCVTTPGTGSGAVVAQNVTSVAVTCTTDTHSLSGKVTGLVGTGVITLANGQSPSVVVHGNASFSVSAAVPSGTSYDLEIEAQPTSEPSTCTVSAPSGIVEGTDVQFAVTCVSSAREIVDTGTQRNGMHSCPVGYAMTGFEQANNQLLCSTYQTIDSSRETVDTGTQRDGMHACPLGSVMTGINVDANYFGCTPLAVPIDSGYAENTDSGSQRAGMHACPVIDTAMSGANLGSNVFLCGGY